MKNHRQGKVGVLCQNDDFGKDYLKGLKDGFNGKMPIIAEVAHGATALAVDSQVINIKASVADLSSMLNGKIRHPGNQEDRGAGWNPIRLVNTTGDSVAAAETAKPNIPAFTPSDISSLLGVTTAAKTAASKLPAKVVQERLGHSSITMTMDVYGHRFPPVDDSAEPATAAARLFAV